MVDVAGQATVGVHAELSQTPLRALLNVAPEAVLIADATGRLVFANQAAHQMYGYGSGELPGLSIDALVQLEAQDLHAIFRRGAGEPPAAGAIGPSSRLVTAVRSDGTEFPAEVTLATSHDVTGPLVVAFVVDVSKRLVAEEALRSIDETYRAVVDTTSEGVVLADPEGRCIFVNSRMAEILGRPREEIVGRRGRDFAFEESAADAPRVREALRHGTVEGEVRFRRPDGSARWTRYRATPIVDGEGRHVGTVALHSDVTDIKQAERALVASEERHRKLIEQMSDGLFLASPDGRYIDVNPVGCQQFGMTREEILASTLVDLLAPEERVRLPAQVARLEEGRVLRNEWRFLRKDGSTFFGELSGRQLPDGCFQGLLRDITDRKETERQIAEYQHQLQEMAFGAALREDRERKRIAENLHDGVGQTIALVRLRLMKACAATDPTLRAELLACARLLEEAGEQTRRLTFDLSPPILYDLGLEPALEWLAQQMHERHGLTVAVACDPSIALDESSAAVVFRTIRELLTNVSKHARVALAKVTVQRVGAEVKVSVEDEGAGFATAHATGTPGRFGLFSVQEQIRGLGGEVEVRSVTGKGSRVTVTVPLRRGVTSSETPQAR